MPRSSSRSCTRSGSSRTRARSTRSRAVAVHDASNVRWAVATALEDLIGDERAERVLLALMTRRRYVGARSRDVRGGKSLRSRHAAHPRRAGRASARRRPLRRATKRPSDSRAAATRARFRTSPSAVESSDGEIEEAADEITSPDMLTELLKARDALGDGRGLKTLIERCRARIVM